MIKVINADARAAAIAIYLDSDGKMVAFESLEGVKRKVVNLTSAGDTKTYDFEIVVAKRAGGAGPAGVQRLMKGYKPISQMCVKNGIPYNWR